MYPTKKLWEIAKVYAWSSAPQENKYFENWKYPFVRTWDLWKYWKTKNLVLVSDYINEKCIKEKNLIFAKKWTILFPKSWASILSNHRWILWMDAYFVSHLAWVDSWNEITNQYLYNFLLQIDLVDYCENPSYPSLRLSVIKEIEIPLPPLPTQKLIVQKLDSTFKNIDESINITKKNIENIDELNKSVLEEVFREWDLVEIWKLVEKTSNWNPKIIWDIFFEYIDISSIDNKNYILTETKKIKWTDAPSRAKQLVLKDDIIFATTRPNLKNIAIIDIDIKNLTSSTWFCVLRTKKEKLYYKFLYFYIITDMFLEKLTPCIRWAQYPAISDKDLKSLKIPLPPLSKQKEIVTYLDEVFEKNKVLKECYEKKLKDLEEMKQSILKEAFEGRLVK